MIRRSIVRVLYGIIFFSIGIVLLGNAINVWQLNLFFDGWWTFFIMVPAVLNMIRRGIRFNNVFVLGVGALLLLWCQGFVAGNMFGEVILAFVLLFVGVQIIFKHNKYSAPVACLPKDKASYQGEYTLFAAFNPVYDNVEFNGLECKLIFSGGKIDLKNAIITKDCSIDCNCIFGGVKIELPENVNVKTSGTAIFGGVDNKLKSRPCNASNPTVSINSTCAFGGVEIK